MAIIWGFDISKMSWSSFGHKKMFDGKWPLRSERFIIYQLAMLIGLTAECTATYSLSKYEDHQTHIEQLSGFTASVKNNDLVDTAIVTIVFCVLVATIFGAEFFFLLFWPERTYPRWYNTTKKYLAVVISAGMLAAAISSTFVVARHSVRITGVSPETAQQYTSVYSRPPLVYKRFPQNIAWVVLIWPACIATIASTVIMFISTHRDERFGVHPKSGVEKDSLPHSSLDDGTPLRSEKPTIAI